MGVDPSRRRTHPPRLPRHQQSTHQRRNYTVRGLRTAPRSGRADGRGVGAARGQRGCGARSTRQRRQPAGRERSRHRQHHPWQQQQRHGPCRSQRHASHQQRQQCVRGGGRRGRCCGSARCGAAAARPLPARRAVSDPGELGAVDAVEQGVQQAAERLRQPAGCDHQGAAGRPAPPPPPPRAAPPSCLRRTSSPHHPWPFTAAPSAPRLCDCKAAHAASMRTLAKPPPPPHTPRPHLNRHLAAPRRWWCLAAAALALPWAARWRARRRTWRWCSCCGTPTCAGTSMLITATPST